MPLELRKRLFFIRSNLASCLPLLFRGIATMDKEIEQRKYSPRTSLYLSRCFLISSPTFLPHICFTISISIRCSCRLKPFNTFMRFNHYHFLFLNNCTPIPHACAHSVDSFSFINCEFFVNSSRNGNQNPVCFETGLSGLFTTLVNR